MKKLMSLFLACIVTGSGFAFDATQLPKYLSSSGNPNGIDIIKSGKVRIRLERYVEGTCYWWGGDCTLYLVATANWNRPNQRYQSFRVNFDSIRWYYDTVYKLGTFSNANVTVDVYATSACLFGCFMGYIYGVVRVNGKYVDSSVSILRKNSGNIYSELDLAILPVEGYYKPLTFWTWYW